MKHKSTIYSLLILILAFMISCNKPELIDDSEQKWLNEHPNLTVGISPNAPPYQYLNDKGELCGIFIDFLSIIEKRLDYKFKKVYDSDFSKLLSDVKSGNVDVLLEIQKTDERAKFLNFTPAILSHSHVIVTRNSQKGIHSIKDLHDKNIAVVNKFAIQEYLTVNFPDIKLTPYFEDIECLRSVSTGNTDAFICQQAVATYYIENEGISNLKIAGEIDYKNNLAIASRKDYSVLSSILTKAVNSISHEEKQDIYTKWLSFKVVPFYQEARFWAMIALVIVLVLIIISLFYIALKQKVRQKTKELELAKNKAEESDRLKTAFLANLSHEIRTPMNGIVGFSSLLKEPDITEDERLENITMIDKSVNRLLNIINDLVDISKIEAGIVEISNSQTNINELIDIIYTTFKPEADKKRITFQCEKALFVGDEIIYSDQEKINIILRNLVKNAFKYTERGTIEFGYEIDGKFIQFFVKDTGMGIPKDRQAEIFKRFIQADISDKLALQGAGLGLSIAQAYVEMLGGTIWVESEEDKGSIFHFKIPFNQLEKEIENIESNKPEKSNNNTDNLKILIAEDEDLVSKFLAVVLKGISSKILFAKTGKEALDLCRNHPDINLILMDLKMPEMDGLEATSQIRKFNKDVLIIAQTAYALAGDKEKTYQAGCNDYISKPIIKEELLAMIQKHCGQNLRSDLI